ncbi:MULTISPECIES: UDP-N-acetylmuramate dehydrogenase [Sphingobacterium]|uniref:UDP-N-acetylenolpyruvoylglucosamine reductase n=1 Tax=Sphingobacterium populi TaxID=1812824 RepID=A0ABW5UCM1_9SPHI|nr:UDP-N-acetylmuramate dehydrogenase [Sphingobacterium sp. CFCC 11742]
MKIIENLDLTAYNSYRVASRCKRAFFPESEEDIRDILQEHGNGSIIMLGSGHNVILSKSFYDQDFMVFNGNFDSVKLIDDQTIHAQAGIDLLQLSEFALSKSLSGMEIFYDIPSSLGGAIVMNAGANGEDIHSLILNARYYDPNKDEFIELHSADISRGYRDSYFQQNPHLVITEATIKLSKGSASLIKMKMQTIKEQRWAKQPKDFPNAGSVFKRPAGYFVGAIMDELSLKGVSIGGAKVSEKHGGFIVNYNKASGEDIMALIEHIQQCVENKYGFRLNVEQRII